MAHFISGYADRVNEILHDWAGPLFFMQEIVEVPGLVTGLLVTYDGIRDDTRETHDRLTWEAFLERMSVVKPDWRRFDRRIMEQAERQPQRGIGGWEGRTIYFLKGGSYPDQWTEARAERDTIQLLTGSMVLWGSLIRCAVERLREDVPIGREHFRDYEHKVRVIWRFLFLGDLGEGQAQSRTEPETEGVEIRDLIFANRGDTGFWGDLKDKYSVSEVVVDAKNTDDLTRDDLRQLYCYLKPSLGFWGIIVCRSEPSQKIRAFNRTLHQNFSQQRGVMILCDDDLRRMVDIKNRRHSPADYLQQRMSEFVRSI